MNKDTELSLAYLGHAPQSAARVLQGLDVASAADYLESVPARLAAPVLDNMSSWHAGRLLEALPPSRAAMVLRQLPFTAVTNMVRLTRRERRAEILEELPRRMAKRLRSALIYPRHQAGAWLDPEVPVMRTNDSTDDALAVLRASRRNVSHVFLESHVDGTYTGAVPVCEVLSAGPEVNLDQLRIDASEAVSNRASLSSVSADGRWSEFLYLPITGRRRNLLGGLSRAALREGLHEQALVPEPGDWMVLRKIVAALLVTCSGILRASIRSSHSQRPVLRG
ncbi:MAG TPA: hypothetical protein VMQ83_10270 [Gammaproteobacteria bacterium]|nr:hypothetical protein [Gammaproteobacteria bacterium]